MPDTSSDQHAEYVAPWRGLNPPYGSIMVDPPWEYAEGFPTQSRTPGKWAGAVKTKPLPYSSMTLDAIKALPVADLAAPDARLFLWATSRYLAAAFSVMDAWGCRYKQALVWHKLDGNMGGSVAPCSAEFLLVGVWGKPPVLAKATSAVIAHAQAKHHSQKPAAFGDLVEQVSPGPYVELFARAPRLGWDAWGKGYEVPVLALPEPESGVDDERHLIGMDEEPAHIDGEACE